MTWSLRIASVAGIGIFLHWTFIILITVLFLLLLAAGDARTTIGVVDFIAWRTKSRCSGASNITHFNQFGCSWYSFLANVPTLP